MGEPPVLGVPAGRSATSAALACALRVRCVLCGLCGPRGDASRLARPGRVGESHGEMTCVGESHGEMTLELAT